MTDDDDQMDNAGNKTLISASSYNALAKATSALASVMSDDPRARCTFTCPLHACGKLFRRLEHLKRHLRTHTLHRPHLCQTCGKRFSRSDNLAQHKKVHQKTATPLTVANSCIEDEKLGFNSPLVYDPFYPAVYNDENYDAFPLDDLQLQHQQHVLDNIATTTSVTDPLMDFSIHDENVSLNSSLCNSPTMGHSFGRHQYYHQYPQQYDVVNSAASSIVPSPSSSSSSPYRGGVGSDGTSNPSNSANDYHYQLQQQQMQALQQALTSCMKKSTIHSPSSPFLSTPSTTAPYHHYQQQQQQHPRPVQVSHRWSLPEAPTFSSSSSSTSSSNVNTSVGSSLLTSPFVPPFQMNDLHGDDHWSQWHHLTHSATAMDLNDLHSFASTS
ncbi:hypothetical protein BCR42DRAFT_413704 [Absidia repens]|uniref:C2H2-type domain-containing protein n=1 Tax=Absidia repens TaxID=90262 RepID=A0A1X2II57_9FUNG|nr:hypothetical protein BCR42DRAFT_413704 [Absidia repens]